MRWTKDGVVHGEHAPFRHGERPVLLADERVQRLELAPRRLAPRLLVDVGSADVDVLGARPVGKWIVAACEWAPQDADARRGVRGEGRPAIGGRWSAASRAATCEPAVDEHEDPGESLPVRGRVPIPRDARVVHLRERPDVDRLVPRRDRLAQRRRGAVAPTPAAICGTVIACFVVPPADVPRCSIGIGPKSWKRLGNVEP